MASSLWTQMVYSSSTTEFMYHLLVTSTHVLQYNHDHILAGHFGQNKTLELVCHKYSWPSLHADVQQFCKFYVTCI